MTQRGSPAAQLALEWSQSVRSQLQQSRMSADLLADNESFTVGVCACHVGAGATTIAQNLAVMLHERGGQPVVLVEGNLRTPVLASRSGVAVTRGFAEFARGDEFMSTIVADGVQRGVSLMAACGENMPLPLLRNAAARLPGLRQKFRHVLVDLPPVLDFPDATLLAAAMDGVVLVIEAEATPWELARRATKRLEAGGVKLLGVVLNKKPQVLPGWLYRFL
ncbi:MAG: CpsD/CapB family tyrosine-protein kinase [Ramlibacter sp.]